LCFEVGDALVVEAEVLSCGLEFLLEGAVPGGERADALLERGVLGGDPLDGFLGPFGLQVADLAEELADTGALGEDLGVGGLERVFGVQCAFPIGAGGPNASIAPNRRTCAYGPDDRGSPAIIWCPR
jgi:hypothetical protein